MKKRVLYLDFLRSIAIVGVMLIHFTGKVLAPKIGDVQSGWLLYVTLNSLGRFAVPLYFMISGCLFLDNSKAVNMKRIFSRNIAHLGCVFFFWSAIYTGLDLSYEFSQGASFNVQMIKAWVAGPTHMWFLYALAGLYLLIPFLRKIAENKKLIEYFLLLWVLFGMLGRFTNAVSELQILRDFLTSFTVRFVSGYTGCFLLGHYLQTYFYPTRRQKSMIYFLGVLSYLFTVCVTEYMSEKLGVFYEGYLGAEQINCVIMASAVYLAAREYFGQSKDFGKVGNFFTIVAGQGLGIYLMHMLVFRAVLYLGGDKLQRFIPWNIVGVILAVYVLCWVFSYLLKKIPHIGRWIV